MHEEIDRMVSAIESLRQENNVFKDYVFPITMSLLSTLLGAGVAYHAFNRKEIIQREKEKIQVSNKCILIMESALSSLVTLKSTYFEKLDNDPRRRALIVCSIITLPKKLEFEISSLIFLVSLPENPEAISFKWRNILLIENLIENYNYMIDIWEKRNELDRRMREGLNNHFKLEDPFLPLMNITCKQIIDSPLANDYYSLIKLTEEAIHFTDEIICEIYKFLTEFPKFVQEYISRKHLNQYGPILPYNANAKPELLPHINKSPPVDFAIYAQVLNQPEEILRKHFYTIS